MKPVGGAKKFGDRCFKLYKLNQPYRWDTDSANKFTLALNSTKNTNKIQFCCDQNQDDADQEGVEMATIDINHIFQNAAKEAGY